MHPPPLTFTRRHEPGAVLVDRLDQLVDAARSGRGRANDDRPPLPWFPIATSRDHVVQLAYRGVGPVSVALIDHEQVGDLEQPCLCRLNAVAHTWRKQHDGGVGSRCDVDLGLTHADGLDEHDVEASRLENSHRLRGSGRHAAELPARCHRPDEDICVGRVRLHAHAIAQQCATRERRRRVDREHTNPLLAFTPQCNERGRRRRLPHAGRTGEAYDVRGLNAEPRGVPP